MLPAIGLALAARSSSHPSRWTSPCSRSSSQADLREEDSAARVLASDARGHDQLGRMLDLALRGGEVHLVRGVVFLLETGRERERRAQRDGDSDRDSADDREEQA